MDGNTFGCGKGVILRTVGPRNGYSEGIVSSKQKDPPQYSPSCGMMQHDSTMSPAADDDVAVARAVDEPDVSLRTGVCPCPTDCDVVKLF